MRESPEQANGVIHKGQVGTKDMCMWVAMKALDLQ